ncbi:ABC transporter substrate-binding protein [Thauera linaloolentis]|uniref:Extracellular ligand-binding receptor n=1 Tax=Thauera linaloolentis (strain DSM 12138 / JCM 21573 / CCUG 41526 / CIP 105981 / IAM 15112 / NBRC 102519 / 47Lol) TaxID=1123367 RepID=N6YUN8_THAL4|nr:ABC transporter substrate-binding protein [Thauera linaloolentis]ENO86132.1 extracellular ligand-binding receptor [Thauera linaloolentis 47Lol = DSM 12138]MCM8564639.1 ABC transporter substrate-binding protein [Thauera linaloolentis]
MKHFRRFALALFAAVAGGIVHAAGTAGVSAGEIVVGHISDLSGPIAMLGTPVRDGMLMRFDEANAAGGVHGRLLRLAVEDAGYDPKRGVLAARKLVQRDKAFAFIATMGTPVVMATMPVVLDAGRLHLFPFSPHQATYSPLHPLKFQNFAPYQDYMEAATRHMVERGDYRRACLLYQDDDYGLEVMRGVEAGLAKLGRPLVERTGYKRGATDLSSQIARLRAAECDLVVLATVVRETVAAMAEARRIGWKVDMLVTASGYSAQTHELGGATVEGLYGVSVLPHPYAEGANTQLAGWIARYRARFGAAPNVWSVMGYTLADMFVRTAEATGPGLTPDAFARTLERIEFTRDFFGSPAYRFSADDHLGNRHGRLAQIRDGRWELITDYLR